MLRNLFILFCLPPWLKEEGGEGEERKGLLLHLLFILPLLWEEEQGWIKERGRGTLSPLPSSESSMVVLFSHRIKNPASRISNQYSGIPNSKFRISNPQSRISNRGSWIETLWSEYLESRTRISRFESSRIPRSVFRISNLESRSASRGFRIQNLDSRIWNPELQILNLESQLSKATKPKA